MKKTISLILTMLMIVSSFSVMSLVSAKETNVVSSGDAYSGTTGDCTWTYDEDTETLTISGNGKMRDYTYNNDTPWKEYSDYGDSISEIIIEDGVTSIGDYVFKECSNLTNITIPNSVKSIGEGALSGCGNLTNITIPDGVTSINKEAFEGCVNLRSITISDNVTSIGESAFYNTGYYNADKNWEDGVLYIGKYLICAYNSIENYTIKEGTKVISYGAFGYCSKLESVTIPNSVVTIEDNAFYDCENLTSISIPNSVTIIGDYAFDSCRDLNEITIGDNVVSIGYDAFVQTKYYENKDNLENGLLYIGKYLIVAKEINQEYVIKDGTKLIAPEAFRTVGYGVIDIMIPETVTTICKVAFAKCTKLTSITIPDSVTYLGDGVFSGCSSLTSIIIPKDVTYLGYSAFSGCSNLTKVTMPNRITSIFDYTFNQCSKITKLTIPNGVTSIGESAFYYCSGLNKITIPSGVTSIGESAFSRCYGLRNITIPNCVKYIGFNAFSDCNNIENVYYQGTKRDWKNIKFGYDNGISTFGNIHYLEEPTTKPTIKVSKVTLNKKSITLVKGRSTILNTKVTPTNATNKKLKWTSYNSKIATVDQNGKVTAKSRGVANIVAMAQDSSGKYAICQVTVKQPVTSVKLNRKSATLKVKGNAKQKTVTLKAKVYPNNANNKTVKWSTSKSKIVIVNSKGKVIAKKKGTCYIIATAKDGSKKSAKCKITVK